MEENYNSSGLLNRKAAAEYLEICLKTLDGLDIPKTKIGDKTYYKKTEIQIWIDNHTERRKWRKHDKE